MSENAIISATAKNITFKSEALNAVTVEIAGYINEVQTKAHANHIAISKALARVASEELYKEDGFKSALEYAMDTFGWKRANAYAMMQVGAKLNANELPAGDFSVSQYREMLPMGKEEAQEAVDAGIITPDMSAKDIRAEVEILKPKKERKAKPEKVYNWHLDSIPGKADIVAPESVMASGEGCDGVQRVTMTVNASGEAIKVVGYLVAKEGHIRFYSKGEEVMETIEGEKVRRGKD